jgi:glycine cleavage system H protein
MDEAGPVEYMEYGSGDRTFRIPESGYYFNNTDCWARLNGTVARVGVSDFVRLDPRRIVTFVPPDIGFTVSIFDGLCSFETDRVSIEINAPVSGTVVSVNERLLEDPGLLKEDPYERGWVAELELTDIVDDMEFLMDCDEYFRNAKTRVEIGPQVGCPCSRRVRVRKPGMPAE